jgi:hypothetical protein
LIYGRVKTGGTIVYQDNSGDENEFLHTVVVFCDGEVNDIESIYFDDKLAYGYEGGYRRYFGKYSANEDGTPSQNSDKVMIRVRHGGAVNAPISDTISTDAWTEGTANQNATGHNLAGCAYAYIRLTYDDEIFTNGFPTITAVIKGKHHYNPMLDPNQSEYNPNGYGDHNFYSSGTYDYSRNPAICLLNYMMDAKFGLGESLSAFDAPSLVASINDCNVNIYGSNNTYTGTDLDDESTTRKQFIIGERYRITNVGTGVDWTNIGAPSGADVNTIFTATSTGEDEPFGGRAQLLQYKYTCDGIIDSKNSHKSNIQNILTSMNGQLLYSNGKYHIKSYKYEDPHTQVIDESMILGDISISTKASRRNLFNRVKGSFVDATANFSLTEYPTQRYLNSSSEYEWEETDGEILYHDYNLPFTTSTLVAQRLAKLTLNRSRLQETIKFKTNAKGLTYTVGDNVKITNSTLGYNEKVFQIQRLNIKTDIENGISVDIEAKENIESFYDWSETELATEDPSVTVNLFDGTVNAPTNLQLESYFENNKAKIRAKWTPAFNQGTTVFKIFYKKYGTFERIAHPATTYDSFIEVELKDYLQNELVTFYVQAVNQKTNAVSTFVAGNIKAAKQIKDNPNFIVRGNIANPTVQDVTELCSQAGIPVEQGIEVTYLQVDTDYNVLNSIDFVFETMSLTPFTLNVNNDVVGESFNDQISNGHFTSTGAHWGNIGTEFSVNATTGKLEYRSEGIVSAFVQFVNDIAIGKKYTLSVTVSNYNIDDPFGTFLTIRDFINIEDRIIDIDLEQISGNGTHTFDFVSATDTLALAFISVTGAGQEADFDNVSLLREDEKATHKMMVSLPPSVVADVTWGYSVESDNQTQVFTNTNSIGMGDTGVSFTTNGLSDDLVVNNRKSLELNLERASDSEGFSQCEITVTASWYQEVTLLGNTFQVPKEATETVTLSARVR